MNYTHFIRPNFMVSSNFWNWNQSFYMDIWISFLHIYQRSVRKLSVPESLFTSAEDVLTLSFLTLTFLDADQLQ